MTSASATSRHPEDRSVPCEHLHDTTTRYDHSEKLLSFLLVCAVCRTERAIHTLHYEPRFEAHGAPEPAGATVHLFARLAAAPALRLRSDAVTGRTARGPAGEGRMVA